MVHKPKHKVHSFRGLLGSGGQNEISLERQNVNLAYRIVKFEIIPKDPFNADTVKHVMKVYRESQSTIDDSVDFDVPDLLGVATIMETTDLDQAGYGSIIFDNTLFSRNIYVTHSETVSSASCNYYIEIEEVPVNAATLMQIKLGTARKLIGAKMGA